MYASERLRLLVGALFILVGMSAVGVLTVHGNHPLAAGYRLHVDFDEVENLKAGAKVQFLGRSVGRVLAIRNRIASNEAAPKGNLRVDVWLNRKWRNRVWRNAQVYIGSDSLVGERRLQFAPPLGAPGEIAQPGEVLRGVDPPNLDRFFNETFRAMTLAYGLLSEQGPRMAKLMENLKRIRQHLDVIAPENALPRVYEKLKLTTTQTVDLATSWKMATDGNRLPPELLQRAKRIWAKVGPRIVRLNTRLTEVTEELEQLLELYRELKTTTVKPAVTSVLRVLDATEILRKQVLALLDHARRNGSLFKLFTDPEMYDDIKEAQRVLKSSPWRALGKPAQQFAPRQRAPKRPK